MISLAHKAVYLSGPMAGKPDYNRVAFAQAEEELYDLGVWLVFNPCEYWRKDDEELPPWTHEEFMRRDIFMLTGGVYKPQFDYVVLLDGYAQSRGAKVEVSVAQACGIPTLSMAEIKAQSLKDFWEDK